MNICRLSAEKQAPTNPLVSPALMFWMRGQRICEKWFTLLSPTGI